MDADPLPVRVCKLHADYQARIGDVLRGSPDPLFSLPPNDQRTLKVDFVRTICWFHDLIDPMKVAGLPHDETVIRHAHRIFNTLYHMDQVQYCYFQGHDRFLFVTYILALLFTRKANLPHDVAESLTFHLLAPIIKLANTDALIRAVEKDPGLMILGEILSVRAPDRAARLTESNVHTMNYALRWKLLLFADEHSCAFDDIANIWDAMFLRRKRFDQFFSHLAFEHLIQVVFPSDPMMITQTIQRWHKWDTQKILRNAAAAYDAALYGRGDLFAIGMAIIAVVSVGVMAIRVWANRK
jgi:hypothetical protein